MLLLVQELRFEKPLPYTDAPPLKVKVKCSTFEISNMTCYQPLTIQDELIFSDYPDQKEGKDGERPVRPL